MHVEIIETSELEREVQIDVDGAKVDKECQRALDHLRKNVRVKGFRPGKVPKRELQRRYGKSVRGDALKTLIQKTLSEALQGESLETVIHVSPPEVLDDPGKGGFRYRFVAEIKPDIQPKGYLGLTLVAPEIEVTDEDIDAEIEQLRAAHAVIEPVEDRDEVLENDWVTVRYEPFKEGDEPSETGGSETMIDLEDVRTPQALKDAIPGMKVGDTKIIDLGEQGPEDESDDSAADQPPGMSVRLTVEGIKSSTLPDIDDDLAEATGQAETLAELRDDIRDKLTKKREADRKGDLRKQLEDKLLAGETFALPTAFTNARLDDEVRGQLQQYGQMDQEPDPGVLSKLRESFRDSLEHRLRVEFVVGAIAEREKLTVSDLDVTEAVEEMARSLGAHGNTFRQLYKERGNQSGLKERLRHDKTLDFLLSKATISSEEPSADAGATEDEAQDKQVVEDEHT